MTNAGYFDHAQTLAPAIDAERGLQGSQPTAADVTAAVNAFASLTTCWPASTVSSRQITTAVPTQPKVL